jgi:hypothetical protein
MGGIIDLVLQAYALELGIVVLKPGNLSLGEEPTVHRC